MKIFVNEVDNLLVESLSGFAWLLGALFGGVLHYALMRNQSLLAGAAQPAPLG